MARIPDFTALGTQLPQPDTRPWVQPDESGEILAGAGDQLGRSITQVGEVLQQKAVRDASTWANNQLTDFQVQTQQAFDKARSSAPDDAHGFTQGVLADFDQRAQALRATAANNPLADQYLGQAIPQLRARLQENAMRWESGQRTSFQTQSVLTNASKLSSLVQSDPTQFAGAAAQLSGQIDSLGLDPNERVQLRNRVSSQLTIAAAQGSAEQDPLGTLKRLSDPDDQGFAALQPQQRTALASYARGQLVDGQATAISQVFANGGFEAGAQAFGALDNNKDLPPDVIDDVRAKANSLVEQLREQRRQQFAPQLAQVEENIANGRAGDPERADVWELYQKGALDPSQLAGTLTSIDRVEKKRAQDGVALQAVTQAYTDGTPLDPKDSTARSAVNQLFQVHTQGLQPGTPGYINQAVSASRTGIVPDSALSWARAHLTAGDPASAAQSADLIARLEEANPRAVEFDLDPKTKAMADTISNAVRAGAPADVAVTMARQNSSLTPAQSSELDQQWGALKPETKQADTLESFLKSDPRFKPGWFQDIPAVPTALQGNFDGLTREYFRYTGGNLAQARQLAFNDVTRVWGESEVNGKKELMPYAPEQMFPGLTAADVRQDVADTVQANAKALRALDPGTGELTATTPAPDSIQLIPTDRTARTGGLEWNLGAPDKLGAMDVLRGTDGNALIYRLPVSQTDFDAVRAKMDAAGIAKARALEAQRQQSLAIARQNEQAELRLVGR